MNGKLVEGGNPYEGPRKNDYPLPPLKTTRLTDIFEKGAKSLGLKPFMVPAAQTSGAYTNPLGVKMGPCTYCGYCLYYGCGNWSKGSPNACVIPALMTRDNFSVITNATVIKANLAEDGKTATGVTYVDQDGQYWEQPAGIVVFSAFQAQNVRLLLLSKIGQPYDHAKKEGVVGRAYCFQTVSGASIFFEDEQLNQYMGAGALSQQVDDYNGDNFDHKGLGFIGGAGILVVSRGSRPHRQYRLFATRYAALGQRLEEGLHPRLPERHRGIWPGHQLCAPGCVSGPRPDLQGPIWLAADAHDLRLQRE